jgi:hypothetical protein
MSVVMKSKEIFVCDIDLPQELVEIKLQDIWDKYLQESRNPTRYSPNVFSILDVRTGLNETEQEAIKSNKQELLWGYETTIKENTVVIEGYTDDIPFTFIPVIEESFNAERWSLE